MYRKFRTKAQYGHHSTYPCFKSSHPIGESVQYMERNAITVVLNIILQVERKALLWAKSVNHVEKPKHFPRKCKSKVPSNMKSKKPRKSRKQIQMLEEQNKIPMVSLNEVVQNTSDNEFTWSVLQKQMNKDWPVYPVKVDDINVEFLADANSKWGFYIQFKSQGHIGTGPQHYHLWDLNRTDVTDSA